MSKNRIIPVLQRRGFNAMIALRGAINHEMCIGEEVSLSPPLSAKPSRSSPQKLGMLLFVTFEQDDLLSLCISFWH